MSQEHRPNLRGRVISIGVAVGVASLGVVAWAWIRPDEKSYSIAARAASLSSMAGAIAATAWAYGGDEVKSDRYVTALLGIGGAVLCAALAWIFGHRHFGGFDHSALIDLAWRLASGQRPVTDFPSTMPIGFVLGAGYAFKIFGAKWTAVVAWQAGFSALTFIWSCLLLLRVTGTAGKSALLAFAVQASSNLVTSYWWYNPATTTAGALFFLSAVAWWHEPRSKWIQVSYIGSLVLLAGMKPNIAAVLIFGITLTLFFSTAHRLRVTVYSALALFLFTGWLALERIWLGDIVRGYLSIASRGFSLEQFLQDLTRHEKLVAILMLAALLLPWLTRFFAWRGDVHGRWLAIVAVAAGGYGFVTNGENKLVDLPLLLLALWWVSVCDARTTESKTPGPHRFWLSWNAYVAGIATLMLVGGVCVGALRQRVRGIGPGIFFQYEVTPLTLATPFFGRLQSGPKFVEVEKEVAQVLAAYPGKRVFFGPRMQWGYAAFSRPSPTGQPVWWHGGVSYAVANEPALVAAWAADAADLMIFLPDDFTYLPPAFRESLQRNYQSVSGYLQLYVLVRRKLTGFHSVAPTLHASAPAVDDGFYRSFAVRQLPEVDLAVQ